MTATQIGILILALIGLALTVAIFVSYARRELRFRALLKRVSDIVERSQGEAYDSKSPTLHEIVERELGPPDEIPPRKNVSALTRKPARKPTAKQKG